MRSHPERRVSKLSIPFSLSEQDFERRAVTFQNTSQAAYVICGEGLQQESLVFFNERDLCAAANSKFLSQFGRNDDLALFGDDRSVHFHGYLGSGYSFRRRITFYNKFYYFETGEPLRT